MRQLGPTHQNTHVAQILLDALPYAVFAVSAGGKVLSWNEGARALFGYSAAEAVGATLEDLIALHHRREEARRLLRAERPPGAREPAVLRRKDGAEVEVLVSVQATHGPGGDRIFALCAREAAGRRTGRAAQAPQKLTPRQAEILQLIAEGSSTKEIARRLDLSVKTVETHRAQLMDRLDIHDVAGLVRYAIRVGLVSPEH